VDFCSELLPPPLLLLLMTMILLPMLLLLPMKMMLLLLLRLLLLPPPLLLLQRLFLPMPLTRPCRYVDLSMNMFQGTLPKFGSVVSARPTSLNLDDKSVCRK
jgi:hypothetical protein